MSRYLMVTWDAAGGLMPMLGVAQRLGVDVPGGLSIVSWDDSALCEVIHPSVTALRRDIPAAGSQAARMLQEMAAGRRPANWPEALPILEVRESSGPARPAAPAIDTPQRRLSA